MISSTCNTVPAERFLTALDYVKSTFKHINRAKVFKQVKVRSAKLAVTEPAKLRVARQRNDTGSFRHKVLLAACLV